MIRLRKKRQLFFIEQVINSIGELKKEGEKIDKATTLKLGKQKAFLIKLEENLALEEREIEEDIIKETQNKGLDFYFTNYLIEENVWSEDFEENWCENFSFLFFQYQPVSSDCYVSHEEIEKDNKRRNSKEKSLVVWFW